MPHLSPTQARVLMKKNVIEINPDTMRPNGACVFRFTQKWKKP
jgi:hypothetical protein